MSRPRMAAVAIEISETKELFGQLTTLQPAPAGPQRIRTGRKRTESTYGRDAGSKPLHSRDGPSLESPTWLATSQRRCERSKKKSRINVTARPWKVRIDRYPSCRLRECKCTSRPSHSFFFVFSGHTMTIDLILPAAPIAPINHNKLILIIGCLWCNRFAPPSPPPPAAVYIIRSVFFRHHARSRISVSITQCPSIFLLKCPRWTTCSASGTKNS